LEKNFKLTIEYDGTDFHGWQRQKNDRSIQGEIESALHQMTGEKINLIGSGRTDAGVHALGQVANFKCTTRLESDTFQNGLNSLLPDSIVIRDCDVVDADFHARFDARRKVYHYRILNRRLPKAVYRQYCWHVRRPLDIEMMNRAASELVGTHDFSTFEGTGSPRSDSIRQVINAAFFKETEDNIVFEIEANGFLRFMVRSIVGTLVDVGMEKISPEDFRVILESRDRSQTGVTAPPQGLFLVRVTY
jgi:tRNA pseudouridine38-40 synthase